MFSIQMAFQYQTIRQLDNFWPFKYQTSPAFRSLLYKIPTSPEMVCFVFWTAFGCWRTQKLVELLFLGRFQPFFFHFKPFSVVSQLKSTKKVYKALGCVPVSECFTRLKYRTIPSIPPHSTYVIVNGFELFKSKERPQRISSCFLQPRAS